MRICSLLPSATEILYAIGLGDSVLGVSHECDFPRDAATKPALLRPRVDPQAAPAEIDRQVSEIIARGELLQTVWGYTSDTETRTLDNFIVRLRRYFEPNPGKPVHFQTMRGVGYRFSRQA